MPMLCSGKVWQKHNRIMTRAGNGEVGLNELRTQDPVEMAMVPTMDYINRQLK